MQAVLALASVKRYLNVQINLQIGCKPGLGIVNFSYDGVAGTYIDPKLIFATPSDEFKWYIYSVPL